MSIYDDVGAPSETLQHGCDQPPHRYAGQHPSPPTFCSRRSLRVSPLPSFTAPRSGRYKLGGLRVDVVADYAGRRFAAVRISVDATGPDPGDMASLLEAAARVCYVTNTLRAGLNVEVFAAHRTDDPARDEIAGPQS